MKKLVLIFSLFFFSSQAVADGPKGAGMAKAGLTVTIASPILFSGGFIMMMPCLGGCDQAYAMTYLSVTAVGVLASPVGLCLSYLGNSQMLNYLKNQNIPQDRKAMNWARRSLQISAMGFIISAASLSSMVMRGEDDALMALNAIGSMTAYLGYLSSIVALEVQRRRSMRAFRASSSGLNLEPKRRQFSIGLARSPNGLSLAGSF